MIYEPSDDSYLLKETLIKFLKNKSKKIKILDMGSGSGIQAYTCKNLDFDNILAVDVDDISIKYLLKNNIKVIKSDLFKKIKNDKFDLIIFNPPYLPEDSREPLDSKLQTTGGKKGYELINKFLEQAVNFLKPKSSILLLFSSLSKPKIILNKAKSLNYNYNLLAKKKIPFEELYIYEFRRR
ncbi:MAG: HemK2/MTQ2 family protein methyltransferase [Nanoarchaeota archaeon]